MKGRERIRAGELFHELIIQQRANPTTNRIGEAVPTWTTYKTRYADMWDKGGREIIQADQVKGFYDTVFEIRADELKGIRTTMRVTYKSRIYNIVHVGDTDFRNRKQLLFCKRQETQANG